MIIHKLVESIGVKKFQFGTRYTCEINPDGSLYLSGKGLKEKFHFDKGWRIYSYNNPPQLLIRVKVGEKWKTVYFNKHMSDVITIPFEQANEVLDFKGFDNIYFSMLAYDENRVRKTLHIGIEKRDGKFTSRELKIYNSERHITKQDLLKFGKISEIIVHQPPRP